MFYILRVNKEIEREHEQHGQGRQLGGRGSTMLPALTPIRLSATGSWKSSSPSFVAISRPSMNPMIDRDPSWSIGRVQSRQYHYHV